MRNSEAIYVVVNMAYSYTSYLTHSWNRLFVHLDSKENKDELKISDYRINDAKLRPRLAAITKQEEEDLECTWTNGTYIVKGVPEAYKETVQVRKNNRGKSD